ncbi:MAG: hypothetical protein KBD29_02645 [Candidatus Magasanikbacteria bacterium]|nr:hypothetical protein [Candidatus Magasanikbacteria bacterium]
MSKEGLGFNPEEEKVEKVDFLKNKLRELKDNLENREGLARLGYAIATAARFNRVLEKLEELILSSDRMEKETASISIRELLKYKNEFDEQYNVYTKNHQENPNDPSVTADKLNAAQEDLSNYFVFTENILLANGYLDSTKK